jgi:GAF domain-containing protein
MSSTSHDSTWNPLDQITLVDLAPSKSASAEVALLDRDGVIVAVNHAWHEFGARNSGDPARTGVGMSYLSVCSDAADPQSQEIAAAIRQAIDGGLPAPVAVTIACDAPDRRRSFDVFVSSRLADDGTCLGATVTLSLRRDDDSGSDSPDGRSSLEDELEGTDHGIAHIVRTCAWITEHLSAPAVLRRTVAAARRLTQARYAAVALIDATGEITDVVHAQAGAAVTDESWVRAQAGAVLDLLAAEPFALRLRRLTDLPIADHFAALHPNVDNLIAVGIRRRGDSGGGVLYLADSKWGEFDDEDERVIHALAELAGQTLSHVQLLADTQRAPVLRPRGVLSVAELKQRLLNIFDAARADAGLGGSVYFSGETDRDISADLATDVEAVVRQGLSNMAEHPDVGVVVLAVSLTDSLLTIDVIDDGRGSEEAHRNSVGEMRRRAEAHGGALEFSKGASRGMFMRWTARLNRD